MSKPQPVPVAYAVSSEVWPYTSPVIAMELCPNRSAAALMCTPEFEPRHGDSTACRWRCRCRELQLGIAQTLVCWADHTDRPVRSQSAVELSQAFGNQQNQLYDQAVC